MRNLILLLSVALAASALPALGQDPGAMPAPVTPYYSRVNTFGVFAGYSNDSSHILLGIAENRKLLNFGAMYERRLFVNRAVAMQYSLEVLPVALESDPVDHYTFTETSPQSSTFKSSLPTFYACHSNTGSGTNTINGITYSYTYSNTCGRRWTIGEGMSPVGLKWNFRPKHTLQPFATAHGGYMYSTQPIPTDKAGSFNFTFDVGVGLELYRTKARSVRAEYRYHHISNHETAYQNPGIDNGLFQVTYAFGR